jgi:hypothetical protein
MINKTQIPEVDLRELENKLKSSDLVINLSFLANPIGNYFKHQQQKKEIDKYTYAFKKKKKNQWNVLQWYSRCAVKPFGS